MDHAFIQIADAFQERLVAAGLSFGARVYVDRTDQLMAKDAPGVGIDIVSTAAPRIDGETDYDRREQYRIQIAVSPFVVMGQQAIRGLWNLVAECKAVLNGLEIPGVLIEPAGFSQLLRSKTDKGDLAFVDILFHVTVVLDEGDHTTII